MTMLHSSTCLVEPVGFKIAIEAGTDVRTSIKSVPTENFLIPQKTLEVFREIQKIGLLADPENRILFSAFHTPEDKRYAFSILFTDKVRRSEPCFRIRAQHKIEVYVSPIDFLDRSSFNTLHSKMFRRFDTYGFTPVNGWEFMFYLDFVTGWKYSWSDKTIHLLDELVTNGIHLNEIWRQMECNVPFELIKESISLPDTWLKKAYGYGKRIY